MPDETKPFTRAGGALWYSPPNVAAPDFRVRERSLILGPSSDLTGDRGNFRHTPLYMYWAHLVGQLPPINAIHLLAENDPQPTLCTLHDATACFQGIERAHLREDQGESVLTYVLCPEVTIEFASAMACMARSIEPAIPWVLTVQVVLKDSLQNPPIGLDGVITRLEAVASDSTDSTLPVDHGTRYRRRCW